MRRILSSLVLVLHVCSVFCASEKLTDTVNVARVRAVYARLNEKARAEAEVRAAQLPRRRIINGGREINYTDVYSRNRIEEANKPYGEILFEGDIIPSERLLDTLSHSDKAKRQVVHDDYLWPNGTVYYYFDAGIRENIRELFLQAARFWTENTCIEFWHRSTYPTVRVQSFDNGCFADLGMFHHTEQRLNLNYRDCSYFPTAVHELAHSLGVMHEMSRSDRDEKILVNLQYIQEDKKHNFKPDHRLQTAGFPYDYGSAMHYRPTAFLEEQHYGKLSIETKDKKYQFSIGDPIEASFLDVQRVNTFYQCGARCPETKLNLRCQNGGYLDPKTCNSCRCPPGWKDVDCAVPDYGNVEGCGGPVTADEEEKTIESVSAAGSFTKPTKCIYHIKGPAKVYVGVHQEHLCRMPCSYFFIEIRNHETNGATGPRFCCPMSNAYIKQEVHIGSESTPVIVSSWLEFGTKYEIKVMRLPESPVCDRTQPYLAELEQQIINVDLGKDDQQFNSGQNTCKVVIAGPVEVSLKIVYNNNSATKGCNNDCKHFSVQVFSETMDPLKKFCKPTGSNSVTFTNLGSQTTVDITNNGGDFHMEITYKLARTIPGREHADQLK